MRTRTIIIAILLIGSVAIGHGQKTWTKKADFAGGTRGYAVAFTIGGKGYVGTGNNFSNHKDFWEYDPATNAWAQKADFGGTARSGAAGFSIGNSGYIGTGCDNVSGCFEGARGTKNDFWGYDSITNVWTQKATFGGAGRMWAVGFSIAGKGYIGTGYDAFSNAIKTDFWEYDPTADIWTQRADFGGGVRTNAAGFSIGNKGYIGTGGGPNGNVKLLGVRSHSRYLDGEGGLCGRGKRVRNWALDRQQRIHWNRKRHHWRGELPQRLLRV
jgi:N-acetylneuraminic acid mutarotase